MTWQIIKKGAMFNFTFISKSLRIRRILSSGIIKPSSSVAFFFSLPFYSHSFPWLFFHLPPPHPSLVPTYLIGSLVDPCPLRLFLYLTRVFLALIAICIEDRNITFLRHFGIAFLKCTLSSQFQKVVLLAVIGVTF